MKKPLALSGCMALLLWPAHAGTIQLKAESVFDPFAAPPSILVRLSNLGSEEALQIRVDAVLNDIRESAPVIPKMDPDTTSIVRIPMSRLPSAHGFYQAALRMRYTDAGGSPASAVSVTDVSIGDVMPDYGVVGTFDATAMTRQGKLRLALTRIDDRPLTVDVHLVLPDELGCERSRMRVTLDSNDDTTVEFALTNKAALAGSRYEVFALMDYVAHGTNRSVASRTMVTIEGDGTPAGMRTHVVWFMASLAALLTLLLVRRRVVCGCDPGKVSSRHRLAAAAAEWGIVLAAMAFVLWHLAPASLLLDTTTVGGDTAAHNYLASHLKTQLFGHGRIVSWAGGWWGGFPMFQFYFCLPYVLVALASAVIPFNIAFKLVSVLGAVALPAAAYGSARLMRWPRPLPVLLAVFMVPFLFVHTHTMWGVNLSSTLAGMISNSLSFALLLLAVGSAFRDGQDGIFRLRSVFLLTLVMASHFFTSAMAGLTLALAPLLARRGGRAKALKIIVAEGALAVALMAWWLVPLIAKAEYSMEFGTNWRLTLWKTMPAYAGGLLPFAGAAVVLAWRRRVDSVWLLGWMLAGGLVLFYFGFRLSPVFVNVRLWPFVFYALIALGAAGLGLLLDGIPFRTAVVALTAVLIGGAIAVSERGPNGRIRAWAEWNYSGLERKAGWSVFRDLVLPLKGTPGRLANDLSPENESLGTSRIFELVPHAIGKPVLEGGVVNSAVGSMFAYYIQSETSRQCAGYPPMVVPSSFNPSNAVRHLELFNVKHFVARWSVAKRTLRESADWRFLKRSGEWELFELRTHEGRYVSVLGQEPAAVETARWKECALEWLYTIRALQDPVILMDPGDTGGLPATARRLTESEFISALKAQRSGAEAPPFGRPGAAPAGAGVISEDVQDDRIRFETGAIGQPHMIKVSCYPNWKVRGADRVWRVTPGFMLVYPRERHVELYYGSVWSDWVGRGITLAGWCLVGVLLWRWRSNRANGGLVR